MKKLILTLILLIITSALNLLSAQDFWEQLDFPDTTDIWCFDINNENDIFVGTGGSDTYGSIYKSSDFGNTWSVFYDFDGELVSRLGISESGNIFVSKGSLSFVYSEDNGESWNSIALPTYANGGINQLFCIGNDTVYLGFWLADGGLLIRTADDGESWDSLFTTYGHTSEHIKDILVASSNEIYIAMGAYFPEMGGVYKSNDNGETWEFLGLLNHSVSSLAINSANDLIAGVRGAEGSNYPGIFVLRNGSNQWEALLEGAMVEDLLINSADHIYFSSSWPSGIGRSVDNGLNFEMINEGLEGSSMGELILDEDEYIYAKTPGLSSFLFKSIKTTVNIKDELFIKSLKYNNYPCPNPFTNSIDIVLCELSNQNTMLEIYTVSGENILHLSIPSYTNKYTINTERYNPGIYIIQIRTPYYSESYKLIKYK